MKILHYELDESGHIGLTAEHGDGPTISVPDDWDAARQHFYTIADGILTEDTERAALEAAAAVREQIAAMREQIAATNGDVLEALEGLLTARTATGLLAALAAAKTMAEAVLTERANLRNQIKELEG